LPLGRGTRFVAAAARPDDRCGILTSSGGLIDNQRRQ
jgi:hypothetical protein